MLSHLNVLELIQRLTQQDWVTIGAAMIPIVLGIIWLWWRGLFASLYGRFRTKRAIEQYKRGLKKDLASLIVIGRRESFDLRKVYVPIGVNKSDLMPPASESRSEPPRTFVLVGGPGAGKSTYVKHSVLQVLDTNNSSTPFFVRLRDYDQNMSIEELIIRNLEAARVPNPTEFVHSEVRKPSHSCVLDGLDEVRPQLFASVCDDINKFYHEHFQTPYSGRLIITCRKEAYRSTPLVIQDIWEVVPLDDRQIQAFAESWPLGYPVSKSASGFWNDLSASAKVLEVSRSPLLLVGSLLLYTESNTGIPGERVRYLERIKNTLVEEWATAQGHAPDPGRAAYTPVLTEIALEMHTRQTPEITKDECVKFIADVLPQYGLERDAAGGFLESLATKTGILVRDVPGHVIFVQFALQEFFASIKLTDRYTADEIANLKPENWWREPVIFAIARAPSPTPYVNALFHTSPLMGALAVAEAPTPSLDVQEAAIQLTLEQLDASDEAVSLPIVALLRKVSGRVERNFCSELAKRLDTAKEDVAGLVGRILATAGTAAATEILSTYPDAWAQCLEQASYLSNTFEKLLEEWVTGASHAKWREAAGLLVGRATGGEKLRYLVDLSERMSRDRAEYLAILILKKLDLEETTSFRAPWEITHIPVDVLCKCINYLSEYEQVLRNAEGDRAARRGVLQSEPGIVRTGLMLASLCPRKTNNRVGKVFVTIKDSVSLCGVELYIV
jgi:NACHT domain